MASILLSAHTNIVLTGNAFYDSILQEEVKANWTETPYSFCTRAEFETLKAESGSFFLITVLGQYDGEAVPGLDMLSLIRITEEGTAKDIVSIPFGRAEEPTGRELTYLPVILTMIQETAKIQLDSRFSSDYNLTRYNYNLDKAVGYTFYIAEEDLSTQFALSKNKNKYISANMIICPAEDIDQVYASGTENAIVSYTISPLNPSSNSYCYKMLIGCKDHKVYMFKKHRISAKNGKGLLTEDMKTISAIR